jgi:methylated-DNA-protein-cysteine methyltransferase-like protein
MHTPEALILMAVRRIPAGCVASYGQVAELADLPGNARQVGQVLGGLPDGSDVPWHRVVNAKGAISQRAYSLGSEDLQRLLLEEEGIIFSDSGKIALASSRYMGARSRPLPLASSLSPGMALN